MCWLFSFHQMDQMLISFSWTLFLNKEGTIIWSSCLRLELVGFVLCIMDSNMMVKLVWVVDWQSIGRYLSNLWSVTFQKRKLWWDLSSTILLPLLDWKSNCYWKSHWCMGWYSCCCKLLDGPTISKAAKRRQQMLFTVENSNIRSVDENKVQILCSNSENSKQFSGQVSNK